MGAPPAGPAIAALHLQAHRRVRDVAGAKARITVEPQVTVDVPGVYVFLPLG